MASPLLPGPTRRERLWGLLVVLGSLVAVPLLKVPLWFVWRPHRPLGARVLLLGVLAFGTIFAGAQLARGAHFASHSAWSAWLCWTITLAALPLKPASVEA